MTDQVQISAVVSEETRALLDEAAESHGLKKGYVIEEAVLQYLHALRELPRDLFIPSRIVLADASGREVVKRLPTYPVPILRLARLAVAEDSNQPTHSGP